MGGTISVRVPQLIIIPDKQHAYELLHNNDAGFHPEVDITDAQSAQHVYDALSRILSENDSTNGATYRAAYERQWILDTQSSISNKWGI